MTAEAKNIRIIEAGADHVDTAAPLFDAYRQFYKKASDVNAARRFLAERFKREESKMYLAYVESGGSSTPAGFVHLYPTFSSLSLRPTWILSDLFVAAEARRRHVGRALMDRATQLARETGADSLILETASDNFNAQKLYEGMGYTRDTEYYRYALYV
jgi:ribosomal protein S18 acetylase RimI-like enzyme